jgi:hypothetical protein
MFLKNHPFEYLTGSDKLGSPRFIIPIFALGILSAYFISKHGTSLGTIMIVVPFFLLYLSFLFLNPILGLYTIAFLGYVILGILRYVSIPMIGLSIDSVILLTFISLFFNNFYRKFDWKLVNRDITLLALLWMGYGLFSVANPELISFELWLSSFRTVSLYMLFVIILTLLLMNTRKQFSIFLMIWGIMTIIATLKGIGQQFIGLDKWEQAWIDAGAYSTHVLFGELRVFSFISDAGQFGANQAYAGIVFIILALKQEKITTRVFYLLVGISGIYGMFLSGTRGAISVVLFGLMLFFLLKRNKFIIFSGIVTLIVVFVFFKYTTIGQDVQQIRRMRTAFDPNDPSFQTRLANQKIFKKYLSTRPFGGGLGHAGKKVQKKLPNSFLANIATDSWFVLIWAEQGVVGLSLHLFILFYIIIKASYLIMYRIRDPIVKLNMTALAAGMIGIMVASYGNAVLGQVPTSIMIYVSMALLLTPERFDNEMAKEMEARRGKPQKSK